MAQSLDAYYTGAGEANGVWVGGGSRRLGLNGEVVAEDLQAVLAGLAPGASGLTPNGDRQHPHPRRVPGFDLTFKAPKSASVLYAVSDDPRVQGAIIDAGEVAMTAAIGWIEREAIRVRRGSHNQAWLAVHGNEPGAGPRQLPTSGVVAASFRHRTSRAGDPLLHWHTLVANVAEGTDGKWSAFAHPDLYRHIRAAGEVFQAVCRTELSHSLGVEWRPGRHVPEIAGIPQQLLDTFSKRTTEIDAWLADTGTPDTPEGRQEAVLATRRRKRELEGQRFDDSWKIEAEAAGWGPAESERLVGWYQARTERSVDEVWLLDEVVFDENGSAERVERTVDPEEWIEHLLRTELTSERSTFTEPDLIRAVAARQGHGATVETLERIAARVLSSRQVIPVEAGRDGVQRWTSRELIDVEAQFIRAIDSRSTAPAVAADKVDTVIDAVGVLGDDQAAAARTIAAAERHVAVLIGPAGTGKTFTVDVIRSLFESGGWHVHGAAPSARAALELTAGAQVPSRTLHSLVNAWDRQHDTPTAHSLLVIDEAGMADIRTLEAAVTRQVAAGGRVLLVGDHHQLPEIGAGGGFAYAATQSAAVAELTVNRRQHQEWEQAALEHLRNGSVAQAVEAYIANDRLMVTETPDGMIDAAVERWIAARAEGLNPILLAGTNQTVDRLNAAVIERLVETGELDGDSSAFGPNQFRIGERVVVRQNSTEQTTMGTLLDIANGQAGTVTAINDSHISVRLDSGDEVALTDRYLRRGGELTHAYALTTHRAQGGTWDLAIAVGADGLYREGAYVELSRGSHENWIVLTDPEAAELHRQANTELPRHDSDLTPDWDKAGTVEEDLVERVGLSHAKQLAHTLDPDLERIDRLARHTPLPDLEQRLDRAVAAEQSATTHFGYSAHELVERLARVEAVARHVSLGASFSPADRNNLGTVIAIDDARGTATLHFVADSGHEAAKTFDWADLRIVEAHTPAPRPLTPAAGQHLAALRATAEELTERWREHVRSHGVEPGDARYYRRAVDQHIAAAANQLAAEQPAWLIQLLGHRPLDVVGAVTWDDGVESIAGWRSRRQIKEGVEGLGPRPDTAAGLAGWESLQEHLAFTRTWLATTDRIEAQAIPSTTVDELLSRRAELQQILDEAPTDWRHVIASLTSGQLTLDDTAELLGAALRGQADRRAWILEHWPDVVERQEIDRSIASVESGREMPLEPVDVNFRAGPEI
ncbi:MAG: MobF family relaxase [Actinomycetota bacterium]|nr:MobF family relaxase [Actinomycetota bacterium]